MAFILFKNLNQDDKEKVINFLNDVSSDNGFGTTRSEAIGVCLTTYTNKFTYLSENMCSRQNFYTSWIMNKKEYFTAQDFIDAVMKSIQIYEEYYKGIEI